MVIFLSISLLFYCQPSICLLSCKLMNMTSLMRSANTPIKKVMSLTCKKKIVSSNLESKHN